MNGKKVPDGPDGPFLLHLPVSVGKTFFQFFQFL